MPSSCASSSMAHSSAKIPFAVPGAQGRAKSSADERCDDMHVFRRKTEDGRKFVANVGDPLGLVPQRQTVTLPACDRGMRLQRVVLLSRNEVFGVDLCGGSGQR